MRHVADIPYPKVKITLLAWNGKYLLKLEQGPLEQTYKVAEADLVDGVNSVFELLDETFYQTAAARFVEMRKDWRETYNRYN